MELDDNDSNSSCSTEDGGDNGTDFVDVSRLEKPYKILTADGIRRLIDDDISTVSDILSVSRTVACTLLYRKNWILGSVYDEWFAAADHDGNPEPAATLGKRETGQEQQICNICYDEISPENAVYTTCRHPFCSDCWKAYVATAINDGPGCLTLSCPEPGCKAAVGVELVELLIPADGIEKYYRYLCNSYVDCSKKRKWCPARGCDFAIEFNSGGDGGSYDVTCDCCHTFCWNCTAENHRPVSCETVANWVEKNNSEAENTNWILAYTKPCPKCRRAIEKNQGCNHMTCRAPCLYRFCWICNKGLDNHTSCHMYKEQPVQDSVKRQNAKLYLERYTHYFERWHSNEKSRKVALADLRRWREEHVHTLQMVQVETQVQFVMEAWEQIVECRRVLKWSYAYGYYMKAEEAEKKVFFEYLQGEAEAGLERLHHCAEKEMKEYLKHPMTCYNNFRTKLVTLTAVTKNYFDNLVRALENDLSEVETSSGSNARKRSQIQTEMPSGKRATVTDYSAKSNI